MFNRRDFLALGAGTTVTLLLAPVFSACTSSPDYSSSSPTLASGCNGLAETSTITLQHSHDICVGALDLTSPPADGVTYTTTTVEGHAHALTLTQAQLQAVNAGRSVTIPSTTANGHTHDFILRKPAASGDPRPGAGNAGPDMAS